MSKLVYPSDGIYKYCKNNIEACSSNLSNAISDCSFDIPSDFTYKSYLSELASVLSEYQKEINSINLKLQKSNNRFETLESDLINNTQKMVTAKIKERDRMII